MDLHSWTTGYIAILLSMTVPVWAKTHFHTSLSYPTNTSKNMGEPFKISVDSTQPLIFLKSTVASFSRNYTLDVNGLIPLTIQPRYILFLGIHTRFNHHRAHFLGIGFGFRHNIDYQSVLGTHIFLDQLYYESALFHVLTTCIEWLTPHLEISLNGYFSVHTQRSVRPLNTIATDEIQYQHDPKQHTLYALYHHNTATVGSSVELILGKRFNDRLKCVGGIYIQGISHLGLLAGVEYPLNDTTHAIMNLTHEIRQSSTRFSLGLRIELTQHTPRPSSLQSRLYTPIERYTFSATEPYPLAIETTQETKKTRTLIDAYAWTLKPKEFNQELIDATDSRATFYLRNQDETGKNFCYGDSNQPITLKSGQSIVGIDTHLRPLPTEINEAMNNHINHFPEIRNTLTLPGQNKMHAVSLKAPLILKNKDITINGLYVQRSLDFNNNSKAAIYIEEGFNIRLDNLMLSFNTCGNEQDTTNTLKQLIGININNSHSIHISNLALFVYSNRKKDPENNNTQYHGKIYGIMANNSTFSIQKNLIVTSILDTISTCSPSDTCFIGAIYGIVAQENSKGEITKPTISHSFTGELVPPHIKYQAFSRDEVSRIILDGQEFNDTPHDLSHSNDPMALHSAGAD